MDEKNTKDFIHETIISDQKENPFVKNGLLQSAAAGAVFGLAALLVISIGTAIWHQAGSEGKQEETVQESIVPETQQILEEADIQNMIEEALVSHSGDGKSIYPEERLQDALENVKRCCVSIERESKKKGLFDDAYNTRDSLSGVIVKRTSQYCYLLTNASSLRKSDQYSVTFFDHERVPAELVKKDSGLKLAILKVESSELPESALTARIVKEEDLQQGDAVLWYGSPSGVQDSLGYGYLSRVGSGIRIPDGDFTDLQISSAADWENGSFLFDMKGALCGIAFGKEYLPEAALLTDGYGLALSMQSILPYVNGMIEGKKRASLGISGHGVTLSMKEQYGMPEGIYVTDVEEKSAAFKAGIQSGDVLTLLDGETIPDMECYVNVLSDLQSGQEVNAVIYRNSKNSYKEMKIVVKPGKR